MREDGHLRWGFIPDPYIEAKLYVENPEQKHHGLVVACMEIFVFRAVFKCTLEMMASSGVNGSN